MPRDDCDTAVNQCANSKKNENHPFVEKSPCNKLYLRCINSVRNVDSITGVPIGAHSGGSNALVSIGCHRWSAKEEDSIEEFRQEGDSCRNKVRMNHRLFKFANTCTPAAVTVLGRRCTAPPDRIRFKRTHGASSVRA